MKCHTSQFFLQNRYILYGCHMIFFNVFFCICIFLCFALKKANYKKKLPNQIASYIACFTSYVFTGTRTPPAVDTAGMT